MSSLMMPRAGAGAVTVEGLTPEVLLAGHTVTVKRGNTVLEQTVGALDVLAFGAPQNGNENYFWNGTSYVPGNTGATGSLTFAGTPVFCMAKNGSYVAGGQYTSLIVCGHDITSALDFQVLEPKDNTIRWSVAVGKNGGAWVILGVK